MIRHILFWNYTEKVKAEHKEDEMLSFLQQSVDTMNGKIDGLHQSGDILRMAKFCSYMRITVPGHCREAGVMWISPWCLIRLKK